MRTKKKVSLFVLLFYWPVNIIKVMSSRSVNHTNPGHAFQAEVNQY